MQLQPWLIKIRLLTNKSRHDWVRKVIHWELCKKLKFNHINKWYNHKHESILENEMHKIIWDILIQRNRPIPTRRPYLVLINKEKKNCHLVDFGFQQTTKEKIKESEKLNNYLDLARKVIVILIIIGTLGTVPKNLGKRLDVLEIRGRMKTFQSTALSALGSVLDAWENLLPLRAVVKNSLGI